MNDIINEGKYTWIDGTPYAPELDVQQYCGWQYGQPNNIVDASHPGGQDCILVGSYRVGYFDEVCDIDSPFPGLCQRAVYEC